MGDRTGISWTDATWNPVRGCSRVSEGCRHCYAERVAARFSGPGQPYEGLATLRRARRRTGPTGDLTEVVPSRSAWTGEVRLVPEHLADPLRWRKPRRIFVNSMSDLFHEKLSNEQIAAVFGVMAACPQHTFQVLTKRAKRMREWFEWLRGPSEETFTMRQRGIVAAPNTARALDAAFEYLGAAWKPQLDAVWRRESVEADPWPLPEIWLGVSVENQDAADERIPELLETPAAVRFLSCEPLLGSVDISEYFDPCSVPCGEDPWPPLDWVIAGCESGPGARPCAVAWLRSLRDQCAAARVPFFLKQAVGCIEPGKADERGRVLVPARESVAAGDGSRRKPRGVIELPYLDGAQHAAFPGGVL